MTLGIIGTAGRGDDGKRLTVAHWRMMTCIAQSVSTVLGATRLVSGGSSWADHVAVQLYLDGSVKGLTLHLPCHIFDRPGTWRFETSDECGPRLNQLHGQFHVRTGINPFAQLGEAISRGAKKEIHHGGFKGRNTFVANEADVMLAFTFSGGAEPKDGGTRHTWDLFRTRSDQLMKLPPITNAGGETIYFEPLRAFHFDLLTKRLFATIPLDNLS